MQRIARARGGVFAAGRAGRTTGTACGCRSTSTRSSSSPPRGGKTGWLARVILRYPGPGRVDHDQARRVRADLRRPRLARPGARVQPAARSAASRPRSGGTRWTAARTRPTAIRRADAFAHAVSQKGVEDATFWAARPVGLPARLLPRRRAGRHGPAPRRPVGAPAPRSTSPRTSSPQPGAARQWAAQLAELRGEAQQDRRHTIRMTMSRALAFLADPALAACVLPVPGQGLDIRELPAPAGTLYLIAEPAARTPPSPRCSPAWPARSTTPPRCSAAGRRAAGSTRRC